MIKIIALIMILPALAFADTFTFSWDAVTKDVNGNTLAVAPGYKLYISSTSGQYGTTASATTTAPTTVITENKVGKYYAVVTAYTAVGESAPSNEVTFEVKASVPAAPTKLTFIQKLIAFIKSLFSWA